MTLIKRLSLVALLAVVPIAGWGSEPLVDAADSIYLGPDTRIIDLGGKILPSIYTLHTYYFAEAHIANRGTGQAMYISPMRDAIDKGLHPTNHTDFVVAPLDQMFMLWSAVNRVSRAGAVIGTDQRVTPLEGLNAQTINVARQYGEQATKGSLEPGKLADLVILDQKPLTPVAEAAAPMAIGIENIEWQRVAAEGQTAAATIRFAGGRVHGFGGCNRFSGGYTLDGDRIQLESLAATMMACEPSVMAAESAFLAALGGADRVSVDAGRLALARAGDASAPLVFEAAPPPRLDGVSWEVTGFNNGRQAVVSPLTDTNVRLAFDERSVYGHAGCNRFLAAYSIDGNTISIDTPAATRMFCDGDGVMEQEQQFLAALASATTWSIERGMLDMHRGDGERVLTARDVAE